MTSTARRAWLPRWWAAGLAWALWALTLLVLAAATVGALVASRRPAHPVGWLLAAMALSMAAGGAGSSYRWVGLVAQPGSLPAAGHLAGLFSGLNIVYISCAGFVLLLTPTGTLPSPRWRRWAMVAGTAAGVFVLASAFQPRPLYPEYPDAGSPIGVAALGEPPLGALIPLAGLVVLVSLVVAAGSLVGRYRRARGVERLQLRWLTLAAGWASVLLMAAIAALALWGGNSPVFQAALGACLAILPLAIGASILRYRLYDLDRIVSRTLAWALVTAVPALAYAAVVLGLGQLLPQSSGLAVAAATLAAAAVLQPARRRVQRAVDRRFNRRRHDAARIIEGFGARLRDQVDLDTLTGEVLAVVDQTMQPTRASLWLRPRASGAPSSRA